MNDKLRGFCPSKIGIVYGRWGGGNNTHDNWWDADPIDPMDEAFRRHDFSLRYADQFSGCVRSKLKIKADRVLYEEVCEVDPSDLACPLYGRLYRVGVLLAFKP